MSRDDKKLVFISYAHADEEEKDQLAVHLEALNLGGQIELWHDRLIGVGEDWYAEIESYSFLLPLFHLAQPHRSAVGGQA